MTAVINQWKIYRRKKSKWDHPDFSVFIVVSKVSDRQWLCLTPTVPDQIGFRQRQKNPAATEANANSSFLSELTSLLQALKPIPLFGYYYGGYDYQYWHQICSALAPSPNDAIAQALTAAQMCIPNEGSQHNQSPDKRFMQEKLSDRSRFTLNFWDLGYRYEIGKTPSGDWIGTRSFAEFEYNP
jgi:hypothetical protein